VIPRRISSRVAAPTKATMTSGSTPGPTCCRRNADYELANEFAEDFLDPGHVYQVEEVNRCGAHTQAALKGVTKPPCEGAEEPCYLWFDHANFA
jgi:hypothetical protein